MTAHSEAEPEIEPDNSGITVLSIFIFIVSCSQKN